MLCVTIDELVPCLKDQLTGEELPTEVIRIKRKSFLQRFNKKNGWYTNWADLLKENEIYALVIKGTVDIQGLIAIRPVEMRSGYVYISWGVAAPCNNPELCDEKKYTGVGGHLLAIAIDRSIRLGYNGDISAHCRTKRIMEHFVAEHGAVHLSDPTQPYRIGIFDDAAQKIREVYTFEWTDDEI